MDSSVLLLAVGGEHQLKAPCRRVLELAGLGELTIHCSVEVGQEFHFHRTRTAGAIAAAAEFTHLDHLVHWHDLTADILRAGVQLASTTQLRGRDAVLVATARAAGFTEIISCDKDFDAAPGFRRIDPADL